MGAQARVPKNKFDFNWGSDYLCPPYERVSSITQPQTRS